jgi:hypothetical protein
MEAANSSETSVSFYVTTQRNIPEDSDFRTPAVSTRNLHFRYYERDLLLNDTSEFCSEYVVFNISEIFLYLRVFPVRFAL